MPDDKWLCLPEDILFQEADPKIATFRYRFIPSESNLDMVACIAAVMLQQCRTIPLFLSEDGKEGSHKLLISNA
jgi:hypothetical protein